MPRTEANAEQGFTWVVEGPPNSGVKTEAKRAEFIGHLRAETDWAVPSDANDAGARLTEFAEPTRIDALLRVLDWVVDETRTHSHCVGNRSTRVRTR
jgi:hypothetical protein